MARTDQPHKLTFEAFVEKCSDLSQPVNAKHVGLDYSKPETRAAWNGSKSKIPIWCSIHQEFFTQQAANHMNGQGCPPCGFALRAEKKRKADPVADFRKVHGDTYDYAHMVYSNSQTKIEIGCLAHGSFWQKPNAHLRGDGCPVCWATRKKAFAAARNDVYKDRFAERAAKVHNGAYALITLPEHSHDEITLNCPKHGDFNQQAHSHLNGHGCPACGRITSYTQRELAAFIEGLGVRVEQDNRTVLGGLHIDIWAPDCNIGVEYNGSYWHTHERVGNKHREKHDRAVKAGVKLIQIFDFEWLERRSAVENRLQALFGATETLAARKCEMRSVSVAEANSFFKENHTQGSGLRHKAAYGLFNGDRLVACATFGLSRYSTAGWELLRYASAGRVVGGFSRLLTAFIRDNKPDIITSYCDLRWGTGGVYKAAGFTLDGVTPPDYWYTSGRENGAFRVSRYAAQHRPKSQTEREWAEANGYMKVLGVGHQRWVLRL